MSTSQTPLSDYLIIDLSSGIAGAYCTKVFADGGAEVVKVETPAGDPLRRWSASGATIESGEDGALFSYLACTKRSVVVDAAESDDLAHLDRLFESADAVVWSHDSPYASNAGLVPTAILAAHPHLSVTAITPVGLERPWSGRAATDFTIQAWSGGIVGLGRGAPDRAPVYVGGRVGEWFAGAYAAAGTLVALRHNARAGVGEIVDLSMLETSIQGFTYHPVTFLELRDRPFRSERSIFVPGVAEASDGMVALGCATAQQWSDLCILVEHPEWIDEDVPLAITARAAELAPEIYAWIRAHTVDEVTDSATAFRIPNAPVANGRNLTGLSHYGARKSFIKNPATGFDQPGHPYRMTAFGLTPPEPAPRLGEHTDAYLARAQSHGTDHKAPRNPRSGLPFAGMRVLDMTAFWAGPSCTHILAMLGAEVIHLESTSRPDMTRMISGVPMSDDSWWEKSPIFSGLNTNKKGITLNIQTEKGKELLRELVKTCDVLVENYTPRVLDQIDMDYESIRSIRPDLIMVRMPGFGLDGPWRDKAAFAYVIEDASGLTWLTGHPDQNPVEPYSIGDPNAGIHAFNGLMLALEHRDRTGEGTLVEASMIDAALNITAEQLVEHSAYGSVLMRAGNRGPTAAPQNLYRSDGLDEFGREDQWVAIAVETDEQWWALRCAIGSPEWAADPALDTAEGRHRHHDLIDEMLTAWCRAQNSDDIVERLWSFDVPVGKVMQPHRQAELPQLQSRGFFAQVSHPVNDTARHSTLPLRFSSAQDDFPVRPAPLLGEHNNEVLTALGLSEDDIVQLTRDKVIGQALSF